MNTQRLVPTRKILAVRQHNFTACRKKTYELYSVLASIFTAEALGGLEVQAVWSVQIINPMPFSSSFDHCPLAVKTDFASRVQTLYRYAESASVRYKAQQQHLNLDISALTCHSVDDAGHPRQVFARGEPMLLHVARRQRWPTSQNSEIGAITADNRWRTAILDTGKQ